MNWSALWRGLSRFLVVALLIGLGIGLTLGVKTLRTAAADRLVSEAAQGELLRVSFDWPPLAGGEGTWLSEEDQRVLERDARRAAGRLEPLSVEPLRRVSRVLGATGWFVADPVVRAVGPGEIRVSGQWRRPAAVVRWTFEGETEPRDVLISERAMRMPPEWRPGGANRPVILGCGAAPPMDSPLGSRYSVPWEGQDIRAGLDLLRVLAAAGLLSEVKGVDVGAHRRGGPLEIVSHSGGRIVWGSAPDEWAEGEPSVAERVRRLHGLLDRTGRIDGGERRIEIHREHVEIDRTGSG